MQPRASPKQFIENKFSDLLNHKITTSRMYEKGDKPGYRDTWFKFMYGDLAENEFLQAHLIT